MVDVEHEQTILEMIKELTKLTAFECKMVLFLENIINFIDSSANSGILQL